MTKIKLVGLQFFEKLNNWTKIIDFFCNLQNNYVVFLNFFIFYNIKFLNINKMDKKIWEKIINWINNFEKLKINLY